MGDYEDGKNILLRRPEPGRHYGQARIPKENPKANANINIDTNAIADAIIKAVGNRIPKSTGQITQIGQDIDQFDTSESLDKLADAMTIPKENEGKVEGIGIIKETTKDEKETKNTIDLLSKLGD